MPPKIINTTPHLIRFVQEDGSLILIPPSGVLINALPTEKLIEERDGIQFVKTVFLPTLQSENLLSTLEAENPGAIIVGSIIAAQTYPGRVFGIIAAEGYERVPPAEKRYRPDKFATFE